LEVKMWVRCVSVVVLASLGLFSLLALTGEGPVLAVKERQMVALGAVGELPLGVQTTHKLVAAGQVVTIAR
jgi:hypothetical protein